MTRPVPGFYRMHWAITVRIRILEAQNLLILRIRIRNAGFIYLFLRIKQRMIGRYWQRLFYFMQKVENVWFLHNWIQSLQKVLLKFFMNPQKILVQILLPLTTIFANFECECAQNGMFFVFANIYWNSEKYRYKKPPNVTVPTVFLLY